MDNYLSRTQGFCGDSHPRACTRKFIMSSGAFNCLFERAMSYVHFSSNVSISFVSLLSSCPYIWNANPAAASFGTTRKDFRVFEFSPFNQQSIFGDLKKLNSLSEASCFVFLCNTLTCKQISSLRTSLFSISGLYFTSTVSPTRTLP